MRLSLLLGPVALLACLAVLLTAGTASAAGTVNCAPYGTATAADVQTAAASGGTVTIDGVCKGTVHLSSSVTLRGGTPSASSGLNGNGVGPVVLVDNGASVTLLNLLVTGGQCKCEGAGVEVRGSTLTVAGSKVTGNTASSFGGGIDGTSDFSTGQQSSLNVADSTVTANTGFWGGGIMSNGASLTLTRTKVSGNTSDGPGGGIAQFGPLTMSSSTISGNSGGSGAGIFIEDVPASISRSTISGNTGSGSGGGIFYADGPGLTVSNSTIDHNTASEGAGIFNLAFYTDSSVTLNSTTVSANGAAFGGAVMNEAEGSGTAGFSANATTFVGNHADTGGAIYDDGINGSAVVTLSQSTIGPSFGTSNANRAHLGAGIYEYLYPGLGGTTSVALVNGTTIAHNVASETGGGVLVCPGATMSLGTGRVVMNTPNNVVDGGSDSC